jgi:hypothetical protein
MIKSLFSMVRSLFSKRPKKFTPPPQYIDLPKHLYDDYDAVGNPIFRYETHTFSSTSTYVQKLFETNLTSHQTTERNFQ